MIFNCELKIAPLTVIELSRSSELSVRFGVRFSAFR